MELLIRHWQSSLCGPFLPSYGLNLQENKFIKPLKRHLRELKEMGAGKIIVLGYFMKLMLGVRVKAEKAGKILFIKEKHSKVFY